MRLLFYSVSEPGGRVSRGEFRPLEWMKLMAQRQGKENSVIQHEWYR